MWASWNLLDGLMFAHNPGMAFQTGYLRELQVRRMLELVRAPHVRTYCEIGMNGGHSLAAMLLAHADLECHVFDLFKWRYSEPVATLLNHTYGGRVHFYPGYSKHTLPPFVRVALSAGRTCDLILVDGGHSEAAVRTDLKQMRAVANTSTRVVIDDIGMPGPAAALKHFVNAGALRIEEQYGPFPSRSRHSPCMRAPAGSSEARLRSPLQCPEWGFAVSRYTRPGGLGGEG